MFSFVNTTKSSSFIPNLVWKIPEIWKEFPSAKIFNIVDTYLEFSAKQQGWTI